MAAWTNNRGKRNENTSGPEEMASPLAGLTLDLSYSQEYQLTSFTHFHIGTFPHFYIGFPN
jgi:hypothetical protein